MRNSTTTPTAIFGYGSLISSDSIRATVPNCKDFRTAYIKGFRREFSYHDSKGWKSANLDLAGIPFCAVDVIPDNKNSRVNGVVFEVNQDCVAALRRRELEYELVQATAYDYQSDELLGRCFVFSANKRNGRYLFGEPSQERYLDLCLNGAKEHGDAFYDEFLSTTYIGDKTLNDMPQVKVPDPIDEQRP